MLHFREVSWRPADSWSSKGISHFHRCPFSPTIDIPNDFRIVCEQGSWRACECDMIDIQATENPISPIMAERYMSTQYKVTFRLRIYRTCPNGKNIFQQICLLTFIFRPIFWVIWGLARWRFWPPVSLVPYSVLPLLLTHRNPSSPPQTQEISSYSVPFLLAYRLPQSPSPQAQTILTHYPCLSVHSQNVTLL